MSALNTPAERANSIAAGLAKMAHDATGAGPFSAVVGEMRVVMVEWAAVVGAGAIVHDRAALAVAIEAAINSADPFAQVRDIIAKLRGEVPR